MKYSHIKFAAFAGFQKKSILSKVCLVKVNKDNSQSKMNLFFKAFLFSIKIESPQERFHALNLECLWCANYGYFLYLGICWVWCNSQSRQIGWGCGVGANKELIITL